MRAKIRAQGAEMVSKRRPLVPPTACGTCFRVHLKQEINQIDSNAVLVSHITKKQATAAEISGGITSPSRAQIYRERATGLRDTVRTASPDVRKDLEGIALQMNWSPKGSSQ